MQAKNFQAMLRWVKANRPDLEAVFRRAIEQDALAGLMAMSFEAGRAFQKENPDAPDGPAAYL